MKKQVKKLRDEAEKLLPDASLKERIRTDYFGEEIFAEYKEYAASPANGTTGAVKSAPRRRALSFVAAALLAIMAAGLCCYFALAKVPVPVSDTFISIDINPSFSLVADKNGFVKQVTPLNKEAVIVLYGMNLTGRTAEEAVNLITAESAALGYLDTSETGEMRVLTVNDNAAAEQAVSERIYAGLRSMFDKTGWSTLIERPFEKSGGIYDDGYTYKYRHAQNEVSPGKNAMINIVCGSLGGAYADYARLSADSLAKLLTDYDESKIHDVENKMDESLKNTAIAKEYGIVQKFKAKFDAFAEDTERIYEMMSDGELSDAEKHELINILERHTADGILQSVIIDAIINLLDKIAELQSFLTEVLHAAAENMRDTLRQMYADLIKTVNEWKSEFAASFSIYYI